MTAWETLIKRYKGKKTICNCGQAYYTNCGEASIFDVKKGKWITIQDAPICKNGCSANQLNAKEFIAREVLKELKRLEEERK